MTTCTCEHVAVLTVEGRTRFLPAADAESARSLAQRMMLAALAQTNWAEQSFQETFRPKALEYAAESCIDSEVAEIAQLVEDAGALEAEQIQFSAATRHPDPLVDPSPYPPPWKTAPGSRWTVARRAWVTRCGRICAASSAPPSLAVCARTAT